MGSEKHTLHVRHEDEPKVTMGTSCVANCTMSENCQIDKGHVGTVLYAIESILYTMDSVLHVM